MSDRRSENRLEVCLDAVWDSISGNYTARITDLSEGGCYVDSLGQALVGEVIKIKLQFQNGDWLELTGAVAHQTPPLGFGIHFVDLDPETLEALRAALADLQGPRDDVSAILSY